MSEVRRRTPLEIVQYMADQLAETSEVMASSLPDPRVEADIAQRLAAERERT